MSARVAAAVDRRAVGEARERLAGLATPPGALGRLGEAAVWLSGVQGTCPPRPPSDVRVVVFAGDHGVAQHGVTAFPSSVTPLMVRAFVDGTAGVSSLARQHGAQVRVVDVSVDDDLAGLPAEVTAGKVVRGSRPIHLEDAVSPQACEQALALGARLADEAIDDGADLLIGGDMGIGNTTPSAALIAASLGVPAEQVAGRGTGVDDEGLARKQQVIDQALRRVGDRAEDPLVRLAALGGADLAAHTAFLARAAERGVPVLLDGVISVACALVAEDLQPGSVAWFAAGHRSPEPAQTLALDKLGLQPLLDVGLRLGEGSGAVAALPLLRSAAVLLSEVALLADVLGS
ncbi:nicotinate-nucleotide--dimethylbenzimidazole phosphoribosyltransferase [Luteipulveratus sp. YIM 133132]|uniref:nicotinate-nucleotide--dimethylbenzimidazole phosphoribosyltransferase n=1 Tax=Luteipulveratus flavus TaxID=3031728 RepID=UPI0023AEC4EE|nr:nicotinate-nucleotide--dimethylbenzimidazole phosphoribosyltransferase [Luteipulveratus sp. YIM 133132]MDE9365239.1 nicotinate-nucleotide--dimethylbenzimidazole phosphoribosyltransferase [Luteipulveratus sp. YIM 133132]